MKILLLTIGVVFILAGLLWPARRHHRKRRRAGAEAAVDRAMPELDERRREYEVRNLLRRRVR